MDILIRVTVERESGAFRSKENIAGAITDELDGVQLDVDGTTYNVESAEFEEGK